MNQQTLVILGVMATFMVALCVESRSGRRHLEVKIGDLRGEMNNRFIRMDDKFDALHTEMNRRFDGVHRELRDLHQDMGFLAGHVGTPLPSRQVS